MQTIASGRIFAFQVELSYIYTLFIVWAFLASPHTCPSLPILPVPARWHRTVFAAALVPERYSLRTQSAR